MTEWTVAAIVESFFQIHTSSRKRSVQFQLVDEMIFVFEFSQWHQGRLESYRRDWCGLVNLGHIYQAGLFDEKGMNLVHVGFVAGDEVFLTNTYRLNEAVGQVEL